VGDLGLSQSSRAGVRAKALGLCQEGPAKEGREGTGQKLQRFRAKVLEKVDRGQGHLGAQGARGGGSAPWFRRKRPIYMTILFAIPFVTQAAWLVKDFQVIA